MLELVLFRQRTMASDLEVLTFIAVISHLTGTGSFSTTPPNSGGAEVCTVMNPSTMHYPQKPRIPSWSAQSGHPHHHWLCYGYPAHVNQKQDQRGKPDRVHTHSKHAWFHAEDVDIGLTLIILMAKNPVGYSQSTAPPGNSVLSLLQVYQTHLDWIDRFFSSRHLSVQKIWP